jgi:beta-glucanase (GH16 family)
MPTFQMVDDYHIYALEWNKDVIKWWGRRQDIR